MPDRVPPLSAAQAAFGGDPATVIPKDGAPVEATVIKCGRPAPPAVGHLGGAPSAVAERRWVVAVPRAAVPYLPLGSTILADFDGTGERPWRVDRIDAFMPDEFRVVVS
jgi:hypothetical protein